MRRCQSQRPQAAAVSACARHHDQHLGALVGEHPGNALADTLAGTGDDDGAALEMDVSILYAPVYLVLFNLQKS